MTRLFLPAMALLIGVAPVRADDPPVDRLQKKPRPAEQKPADDAKPKPPEKADEPKSAEEHEKEAAKLRDEIAKDMQSAEKKLKDRDPGRDTQQLQDRVLRNIDKLLDLARNPPPPPPPQQQPMDGGQPPPMGGEKQPMGGQQPQGGSQSQPGTQQRQQQGSQSRRERREQRRQQSQQARAGRQPQQQPGQSQKQPQWKGGGQTTANPDQPGMGGRNPNGQPDKMADVVKDIWGHLPETLRQEVDHYYRDRFMPRYRDLLQEYYGRLAERDRARREDRR
jgi:hypothetical protein